MNMSLNTTKPTGKPAGKPETQPPATRKTAQEPPLKCPRCDSPNTKFCYYNNYSLTQPRHFCKTCRRYWTRGGALRNVPIGGGCRKNKKMKPSSPRIAGESTDVGGLKLFQGISPAMDFQLQGINFTQNSGLPNQFSSYGEIPNAITSAFLGNNNNHSNGFQDMGSLNMQSTLANSIESLSCINQDLHWKLQQQRLSMLLVDNQKEINANPSCVQPFEKPETISFRNLGISKTECPSVGKKDGNLSTEWFFDNSYNQTPATSGGNLNENGGNWSGAQGWSDLGQYSSLP